MKTVHRFEIPPEEVWTVALPVGSRVLHIAQQQRAPHAPCMWVLLDDERAPPVLHTFVQCGTGTEAPGRGAEYIGTYQAHGYVFHVFEVIGHEVPA